MRPIFVIGLVVIGVLLLSFLLSGRKNITNYPPKNDTIVAFGDSLIAGYGATRGNDLVSVVSTQLKRNIINLGVSGDTSADGLARIDAVLKQNPGTVLLLIGGNDFLRKVSIETTEKNLRTIIQKLTDEGVVIVLLGVRSGLFGGESDRMYEKLHDDFGTLYIEDVLSGIFLRQELMYDTIHPNDRGYVIIAERIVALFQEYEL